MVRRAVAVVFAALVACGSFEDAPSSAAPIADAAAPETNTTNDAAEAGVSGFCGAHPGALYCEDFDGADDARIVTDLEHESSPASLMPNATRSNFVSPPRSLQFNLARDLQVGSYVVFKRSFPEQAVRLDLDMRFDVADERPGSLQSMTLRRGKAQVALGRTCGEGLPCAWLIVRCEFGFEGGTKCTNAVLDEPPFLQRWAHVVIEADFVTNGRVKLTADNRTLYEKISEWTVDFTDGSPTEMSIGINNSQGDSPFIDLKVDNVLMTKL